MKRSLQAAGIRASVATPARSESFTARQDEVGTPWCVTVDFKSLEDGTVTVRDRDSMAQDRLKVDELESTFNRRLRA